MMTSIMPTPTTSPQVRATEAVPVPPPPVAVMVEVVVPGGSSGGQAATPTLMMALPPAARVPVVGVRLTIVVDDSVKLREMALSLWIVIGCGGDAAPPTGPSKMRGEGCRRQGTLDPCCTSMVACWLRVGSATLVAVRVHMPAVAGAV
jgi:hypothetical protein